MLEHTFIKQNGNLIVPDIQLFYPVEDLLNEYNSQIDAYYYYQDENNWDYEDDGFAAEEAIEEAQYLLELLTFKISQMKRMGLALRNKNRYLEIYETRKQNVRNGNI